MWAMCSPRGVQLDLSLDQLITGFDPVPNNVVRMRQIYIDSQQSALLNPPTKEFKGFWEKKQIGIFARDRALFFRIPRYDWNPI